MSMKFSINTEDFSSRFIVLDNESLERYSVKNEMDSVMRKLTIYDLADNVVCTVEKKFFTLRPTYVVYNRHNQLVINIRKKLNLLRPVFTITSELDEVKFHTIGDYFGENFSITSKDEQEIIAKVVRKNGYKIEIIDSEHDVPALIAIVIIIHLCCQLH
ncbi:hypothetical protein I4U23_021232 [Adineta vaga]|nr:hypothetical protein I4U23_021232 [Adineta vaga]